MDNTRSSNSLNSEIPEKSDTFRVVLLLCDVPMYSMSLSILSLNAFSSSSGLG